MDTRQLAVNVLAASGAASAAGFNGAPGRGSVRGFSTAPTRSWGQSTPVQLVSPSASSSLLSLRPVLGCPAVPSVLLTRLQPGRDARARLGTAADPVLVATLAHGAVVLAGTNAASPQPGAAPEVLVAVWRARSAQRTASASPVSSSRVAGHPAASLSLCGAVGLLPA